MTRHFEQGHSREIARAEVQPAGTEILQMMRCGDKDRLRTSEQVDEAWSHGYLNDAEAESRRDAIGKATRLGELALLVSDLPPRTRWTGKSVPVRQQKPEPLRERWQEAQPVSGIIAMAVSVLVATMPGLWAQAAHLPGLTQAVIIVPTAMLGIIGFCTGLVSMIIKLDM